MSSGLVVREDGCLKLMVWSMEKEESNEAKRSMPLNCTFGSPSLFSTDLQPKHLPDIVLLREVEELAGLRHDV